MEVRDSLHLFRLSFRNRKKSYCIYSHCLTSEQGKGLGLDRDPSGVACWMHVSSAVVVEVVPSLSHALCLDREGGDYRVPVLKVPKALPSLRAVFCFVFHFAPRCLIIMLLLAAFFLFVRRGWLRVCPDNVQQYWRLGLRYYASLRAFLS